MAVVIITHNIEMMRIAENIVMLEHGRVVEHGRFDELRKKGGAFAMLISGGKPVKSVQVPKRALTAVKARKRDSCIRKTSV